MSGLFPKPKAVRPPVVKAEPEIITETEEAGEEEKKRAKRRRGRRQTVITGALEPVTAKKTLLG